MTRTTIVGGALAILLVLLALVAGWRVRQEVPPLAQTHATAPAAPETPSTAGAAATVDPAAATSPAIPSSPAPPPPDGAPPPATSRETAAPTAGMPDADDQGFLYGRVTNVSGTTYEGRLRWGGDQEAFWGDYFNGTKDENPWAAHAREVLPKERHTIEILGIKIGQRENPADLGRPFMVRFGDIARIEAGIDDVRVTLKSGTAFDLNRQDASDVDDGVRVWDARHGVVDVDWIRTIEFLPTARLGAVPGRLHGTVHTRQGDFTGFIQWDRKDCVGTDELHGQAADGKLSLRFDTIRSIARRSRDRALVTLLDGREIAVSDTRLGHFIGPEAFANLGIYVDDLRYGRVLISWAACERIDFSPAGSGPAYGDFPPGRPLMGSVTARDGRRIAGRLVWDFDESETTETLDAPSQGVDYMIPFGLIASIVPRGRAERETQHARVTLQTGEELLLEGAGDLGERNTGLLIFAGGSQRPEFVPWTQVERIEFESPPAMYPPPGG